MKILQDEYEGKLKKEFEVCREGFEVKYKEEMEFM